MTTIDDKTVVQDYFNAIGFDRWKRIYGDGEVNTVQQDIREGHQKTIDTLLAWLAEDGNLKGLTICDAGCGVGSLSIPLAQAGAKVDASDISEKMVAETEEKATLALKRNTGQAIQAICRAMLGPDRSIKERIDGTLSADWKAIFVGKAKNLNVGVKDLDELTGRYHTVICLDVLIHYPTEQATTMIQHLATLAESRLILSFAPKTFFLTILKKIGEFFPGPSKTTRAYQHKEVEIVQVLTDNGFQIQRKAMTSTRFYFSQMLEAVRV